jgi:hypothetical protein
VTARHECTIAPTVDTFLQQFDAGLQPETVEYIGTDHLNESIFNGTLSQASYTHLLASSKKFSIDVFFHQTGTASQATLQGRRLCHAG